MAAPLTNEHEVSWPASPLSHLWKVLGFVALNGAALGFGFWPSPLRLDIAVVAVAATRSSLAGITASIFSLVGTALRHHDLRHIVAALAAVTASWLAAAVLRRDTRTGTLPSRAVVRLLALAPVAIVAGLLHSAAVPSTAPNSSAQTLESAKILAGLLLAAVTVKGPRRGREASPLFLTALVAFATVVSSLTTVAVWERQDEALLTAAAESTTNAFLSASGEPVASIVFRVTNPKDPVTEENFDTTIRPIVFANQSLVASQLLDVQSDGTIDVRASVGSLGADFDAALTSWMIDHPQPTMSAAADEILTYAGLATLPHPTLGTSPVMIYLQPASLPEGAPRTQHVSVITAVVSIPSVLSSPSMPTVLFKGEAVATLFLRLGDTKVEPIWTTSGPSGSPPADFGLAVDEPVPVRGTSAVNESLLNSSTFITLVERRGDFGTPQNTRRLILLVELGIGLFLGTMVLVNGNHRGRREHERIRREALLGAALEGSAGWTSIIDSHDRVVMSNSDRHALSPGNVITSAALWNGQRDTVSAVTSLVHAARLGTTGSIQHVWSDPSDPTHAMRIFEIEARPLPDPTLVYLQCVDVTENRDRAMRTAQSERMEAIGVLAGGLAHDFNNLLFITLGYLQMLERQPKISGDMQTHLYVQRAIEAVERGATVAKSLLSLARSQPLTAVPLNLRQFFNDIRPLVEQALGPSHHLELVAVDDDLDVVVDPGRLSSGLLNIVFNARDAMENSGTLEIRAEHCVAAPVGGEAVPAVAISVRDTGKGMSPDVLARAFEPFFTTKRLGSGTGLGLSTVYSFAQQSGGWAAIDSTEGVGTTVSIFLPPALVEASDAVPAPRARTATKALVVDDEAALADLVAGWLSDLGMETQVANNPDDAIRIAQSFRPELLVSDANLGADIDGLELARQLVERDPSLLVIFMTGFSERIKALQAAGVATLAKPFSRDDLAANVSSHLGKRLSPPDEARQR